jgi:membrane protein insertase Oxa1/YidC/SpoIIIJ
MYKISDDKYLPFKKNSLEYKVYKITNSFVQSKWDDQNPDIKKIKRIISLVKRSLTKQQQEFGPFYEKHKVTNLQNTLNNL